MIPGLGEKYDIDIETIAKPKAEYMTDEYFELDLPVAPAVMVGDEIIVEGTDVSENRLEAAICLFDRDGDIVHNLSTKKKSVVNPCWACYHTQMYIFQYGEIEYA